MIKIIEKSIDELVPYENNARINDKAVDVVANSIKEFGFKNPCIIDRNNVIVAGHTRVLACKKLGIDKVPCIVADDLTEEQIKAFRIADNSSAQIAEWDIDKLMKELETIDYDMAQYGLAEQMAEIEKIVEKQTEEDDFDVEANLPEEPKAKLGDIYELGNHRLMCGDSTKEEDVAKLMDGKLADLCVTDPPYNVNIGQGGGSICSMRIQHHRTDGATIKNDNMEDDEFYEFLIKAFKNLNTALKNGGVFYIWHGQTKSDIFIQTLRNNNLEIRQMLIWNKDRIVMGRQDYQWKHEGCIYGWKEGAAHYFVDDRTQTTVFEDTKQDFKKMKKEELIELLKTIYSDKISTTIINEKKPNVSEEHPTMKPINLIARNIKNSSKQNENILDLFGGSGTTLMACEQLNRKCYIMEYDPHYVDVIIARWEQFTGKKAEKIN